MARKPRLDVPGVAQHVIQRGHNREVCFAREEDFAAYAGWLHEYAAKLSVDVHAWVFMTNHVHLLMTPKYEGRVSELMQSIGRRYVPYFNFTYKRSGTLWGGRFKSSLVESQKYVLECYRYIELNPVRAAMVSSPGDYKWSSYCANAEGRASKLITPHEEYLGLSETLETRLAKYRAFFEGQVHPQLLRVIQRNTEKGFVIGSDRFADQIAKLTGQRVVEGKLGRPAKTR